MPQKTKKHYHGHRKRLRERFLKNGLDGFHDYEIVELLLTLATPRKDCKKAAKEAIKKFHNLSGVIKASDKELQEIKGIGEKNIFGIKFFKEVGEKYLEQKLKEKKFLKNSKQVYKYLVFSMRDKKKEIFKVIFLDNKNAVITIETLSEGTIDSSVIYPREIVKKALDCNATGIILVHNHPSGNLKPNTADKTTTKKIMKSCQNMGIKVIDHIVIGDNEYLSYADIGKIKKWNRIIENN
ncbi:MAG: DNA repair protein RadC [Candidatus Cloacimonetes bacterium]|nr:DNA repair protein RadC [Candidatus Cloacimonadota bacterium]